MTDVAEKVITGGRKGLSGTTKHSRYTTLIKRFADIIYPARATAVRQINKTLVLAYYEIGMEIMEGRG